MKNSIKYLLLLITAAFIGCKEEPKKPKVSYEKARGGNKGRETLQW